MIDPTFMIPDSIKQRFVDGLVEFLAERAEQFGSDQAAQNIRKLSSEAAFRASADRAFQAGIERFVEEYREQDEDMVDAIMHDTVFWQSPEVQQALLEMVQRPGAWMPGESATVAHHFEWVQPQRINRGRVDKAVSHLLGCIAQELWSLPGASEVRDVYGLQFQKMTAEATRQQVALAQNQLEVTTQLSDNVRQALLQLTSAMEKNLLAPPGIPAMVASPKPYNNLPQPTYVRFVGREAEFEWLRQRLSPTDRAWQIAVTGIGGVGKTALALAVTDEYRQRYHELPSEERFDAIVWVSAKEEVLTVQGRERADLPEAILHTLEDVYTAISRVLEREDITRALPEDQDALVQKALQRQRTLLIMDNMESVQDDRIKAFLRKLPAPTKAIITSREWIDVADVKVLKGLSPEDAKNLIEEEATVRGVTLDAKQRERLFDLTAGLPLPLKLSIARISAGESFAAVTRWLGDAMGDLPEYCIKGQIDLARQRDPNTWIVLLACALFDREIGASREALGKISDLSWADCDIALAHLQKLFLVSYTKGGRLSVLPLVQRYANAEFQMKGASQLLVERWLKWLADFAQTYGVTDELEPEGMQIVGSEYPNLRAAIGWCFEHQMWERLMEICEGTWPFAQQAALLYDLEEILISWLRAAQATINHESEAHALTQLGWLYWTWRRTNDAKECLDGAEHILDSKTNSVILATAWEIRAQILTHSRNFDESRELALRAYQSGKEMQNLGLQFRGAYRLAAIEAYHGNYRVAADWLDVAEDLANKLGSIRRLAAVKYRRGANLILEGRFYEAESFINQALEVNISRGEYRHIAVDKHRLAEIYAKTGRLPDARQAAEEARELFDRFGSQIRSKEVESLFDQISR